MARRLVVVAPRPVVAIPENAMNALIRLALHIARVGLLALLIVQSLQMVAALAMLDSTAAMKVSAFLPAAIAFKALMVLANLALLLLAHRVQRRFRRTPPSPSSHPSSHGVSS